MSYADHITTQIIYKEGNMTTFGTPTGAVEQREISRWHRFDLLMLHEMLATRSMSVPAARAREIGAQAGYDPRGIGGFVRYFGRGQEASYERLPEEVMADSPWHLTETGYRILLESLVWAESTLNMIEPGDGGLEDMG
jgi:hypothetical protein